MTYAQIAESLLPCPAHEPKGQAGCSLCVQLYANAGTARRAIVKALEDEAQQSANLRDEARREQLAAIDVLLRKAISDSVNSPTAALRARSMTAAARFLDQRARLQGLYAPTQVQITDELDALIEDELQQLAETPIPESLRELP